MCLLTFMQEYTTADVDSLAIGSQNNPDGFGYAVHAGTHIVKGSGLNFDAVLDNFLKTRAIHSGPALFHSRITTHGGTNINNCHPFQVGKDTNTVVAHNGMLPIAARNGMSDTHIFAKELFPSWGGASTLNSKKTRRNYLSSLTVLNLFSYLPILMFKKIITSSTRTSGIGLRVFGGQTIVTSTTVTVMLVLVCTLLAGHQLVRHQKITCQQRMTITTCGITSHY